jgi:hypothetical protein
VTCFKGKEMLGMKSDQCNEQASRRCSRTAGGTGQKRVCDRGRKCTRGPKVYGSPGPRVEVVSPAYTSEEECTPWPAY